MASAAWTHSDEPPVPHLSPSSLWQRSLEALVVSSCSRVMFIFSSSRRHLSDRVAGTTLGGTCICWLPLVSSAWWAGAVGNMKEAGGVTWCGHPWRCLHEDCCWGRMAESIPSGLRGYSVSLVGGGAPRATNSGSLLGILCWETGTKAVGEVHCSHFKAPGVTGWMAMAMLWGAQWYQPERG